MPAEDRLSAALEEIRDRRESAGRRDTTDLAEVLGRYAQSAGDVPRLLAAVEAALEVHALTALHRHTEPCDRHRYRGLPLRLRCPDCRVIEWTGCDTCRDEYGNPARPEDCTTRQAITRALLGEEEGLDA